MDDREQLYGSEFTTPYAPSWDTATYKYYLDLLRRRMWPILAIFVISLTIGVVNAFKAPKVYRSSAKVMVQKYTPRIKSLEGMKQEGYWYDPNYYNTQVELIQSRVVLGKAVEALEASLPTPLEDMAHPKTSFLGEIRKNLLALLGARPEAAPERWERIRGHVSAKSIEKTHFILITGESQDPNAAPALANAVARTFADYHLEKRKGLQAGAFVFLKKERAKEEKALIVAERELQEFHKKANRLSFGDKNKQPPVLQRLSELNDTLTQTQLKRIDLMAQLKVVQNTSAKGKEPRSERVKRLSSVPVIRNDRDIVEAQKRLLEVEKTVAGLGETYGSEHPLMRAAVADVAARRQQFVAALNQRVLSLISEVRTLQEKEREITRQYEEQKAIALVSAKEDFEYARLQNEVGRHRRLLDILSQRMQEVGVSSEFIQTNVEIVETALVPKKPFKPDKRRMIMLAAIFGLFLGVGLAFAFEYIDDTIKTPEDLRLRVKIPLLGFVPHIKRAETELIPPASRGTAILSEPISSVSEAFRTIRTSLFFSIPANETKTLALTSCGPAEGKTTTIANLAVCISQNGKRVLLIDADLHRPMIHKVFGLDKSSGLTNLLVGEVELHDAVQSYKYEGKVIENLDIMPSGSESPNPAELLGSQRMKELLLAARTVYDWILVDTPPVLFVSDAAIVSAICDGVVLVVQAGTNNRSVIVRTQEHLEAIKARIVGSILNDVVLSRVGRYYSDYYHHGYSRYARDYHDSYYSSGKKRTKTKEPGENGRSKPEEEDPGRSTSRIDKE